MEIKIFHACLRVRFVVVPDTVRRGRIVAMAAHVVPIIRIVPLNVDVKSVALSLHFLRHPLLFRFNGDIIFEIFF